MRLTRLIAALSVAALTTSALAQPAGGPPGMGGMPNMGAMGPTEVGVVTMHAEAAPITTTLPGRVIASATAEVRPQVGGIVTAVEIREGQPVEAGDLIATVDPATYQAEVSVAEAALASAQAQLPNAQAKADRYEALVDSGGVSQAELSTARVELAQAKANVTSAEAQLQVAKLTLERANITAPIGGIVGAVNVQVGSLLTSNQAEAVTTIRQIDPVDITLVESSSNLLATRSSLQGNQPEPVPADAEPPPLEVTVVLEDGSNYDQIGSIASMDFVVSQTTGTFTLRASMPNPDRVLLPGMFVRASIKLGDQNGVFLVPQRAVTFNEEGRPTAYFVEDGKSVQRVLTAERALNNAWVVTTGVAEGDQLIVDGLQKIRDGGEVSPLAVTIDENGVVNQEPPSMPAMPGASGPPAEGTASAGAMPQGATPPAGAVPQGGTAPSGVPEGQAEPPAAQEG